nr:rhodanese [Desulfobulbaceae bacterium]
MSTTSAGLAKKLGYTNIKVMLKGVPGWKKAKNKVVASDAHIEKGNIILVDVRPAAEAAKGFIDRAVNIPFDELEDAKDDFPLKAPVVVYGDDAEKAYSMIAKWGLKTVALVDGGLEGYVSRGHALKSGEPDIDVSWERKLGEGEVTLDEFIKASEGKVAEAMILDVRTTDETAKGQYSNSVAIPLDELEGRIAELSKDKEYLIHCSTGARAEMAYAIMKKAGMKSRCLIADVECTAPGECSAD